jgi:hypothetical protein
LWGQQCLLLSRSIFSLHSIGQLIGVLYFFPVAAALANSCMTRQMRAN